MATTHRLPTPGSDNGTWGDILNDFLLQAHNADGSLQNAIPKPAAGINGKPVQWNSTSGALEDASATLNATFSSVAHLDFNVMDYGAKGDGSTDDTAAISAAIDAAIAVGNGEVIFPRGAIFIYSSILKTGNNLTFRGGGILRSTLGKSSNTIAFQIIGDNVSVEGLTFDYTVGVVPSDTLSRGSNGKTIRLGGTSSGPRWCVNLRVIDCTIRDARNTPIDIYYGDKVVIRGNHIERSLGNGIFITDCKTSLRITENEIYDTGDDGIFVACDASWPATKKVVISSNTIELSDAKGIGTSGVDGAVIEANHITNTWGPGIRIIQDSTFSLGRSDRVLIRSNIIRAAGGNITDSTRLHGTTPASNPHGIEIISGTSNIKIDGNHIENPGGRGVLASSASANAADHLTVSRNRIKNCPSTGIEIGNSGTDYAGGTNVAVHDNELETVVTGILTQNIQGLRVTNNQIRSFKNGSSGETRGVYVSYVREATVSGNLMINDDAATYGLRVNPTSTNYALRYWNNQLVVPANNEGNFQPGDNFGSVVPQRAKTGSWITAVGCTISTGVLVQNRCYFIPIVFPVAVTATELNVKITVAAPSSTLRLGIYADDGSTTPGTLILDTGVSPGSVDSSTTGLKTVTISQALPPGVYWLACACQGGTPTVNVLSGRAVGLPATQDPSTSINGMYMDSVSGALPTTPSAFGLIGGAPALTMKV